MIAALPEYHGAGAYGSLLQVDIKVPGRAAALFLHDRLRKPARTVRIVWATGHWLLTVRADSTDMDELLVGIAAEVDALNRSTGPAGQAELLENRLVALDPGGEASAAEQFGLVFEAGNSFGTGRHPSTRLAVTALIEIRDRLDHFPEAVLDLGCGSGILALLSARFGARQVLGLDIASEAVAQARRNVAANRLSHLIAISAEPFERLTARFDLITANLTASVLLRLAPQFAARLNPGGLLIVAGIQGRQVHEVTAVLARAGFASLKAYESGPWRAGLFILRARYPATALCAVGVAVAPADCP